MKKLLLRTALLAASSIASTAVLAEGSVQHYGQSFQDSRQSATHSAESFGNTMIGTSKLVTGLAALPFKVIGKAGEASGTIGDFLWENANGNQELEVSDETVTAGPMPLMAINH